MKFDSRFTIGNLLSIVVMLVIAVGAVAAATSHINDEGRHPKGRASADDLRSLQEEVANGFREQRTAIDAHFDHLSTRIDGLYENPSKIRSSPLSGTVAKTSME
jgi:hypothetical protein